MARPHIEPFCDRDIHFKTMVLPGFGFGMRYKMLSMDVDNGSCSMASKSSALSQARVMLSSSCSRFAPSANLSATPCPTSRSVFAAHALFTTPCTSLASPWA